MTVKKIKKATDLNADRNNANSGSIRGMAVVEESIARYGTGRSVLADRHGNIIAGNTTTESFIAGGTDDVIVVESDGTKLVVVQRTDLDLTTDVKARELAHADNRTNQIGYAPDINAIDRDVLAGADLDWLWRTDELDSMRGLAPPVDEDDETDGMLDLDKVPRSSSYELVVLLGSEDELAFARKQIQDLGYFIK